MNCEKRTFTGLVLLAALALLAGCGPAKSNHPETTPVSGTVTYKGEPVADAMVNFMPQGQATGVPVAVAMTDASGTFKPMSFPPEQGMMPGNYTVTIRKQVSEGPPPANPEDSGAVGTGKVKDVLPAKYADPGKSGLTAEVKKGANNKFDFNLTD